MEKTRESVIIQIEKKLNDAHRLALENKGLIGNSMFADSILSLKTRWCVRGVPTKRVTAKSGKSRAITFTQDDFKSKKKARDVKPVADEFELKTVEEVKVLAKSMGLATKGKDKSQLVSEIEWERADQRTQRKKGKSEEE